MALSFSDKLAARWETGRFVCFGFDPVYDRIPKTARLYGDTENGAPKDMQPQEIVNFCKTLIDPVADIVGCFKPNVAFYQRYGSKGIYALEEVIRLMRERAPNVPIILDAKLADIGNTNEGYAEFVFDHLQADAITVHPYLGHEAMEPFLRRSDKGVIVLCRTSNPGGGEFQDLVMKGDNTPLYKKVADNVSNSKMWNKNGNCGVVVGATYPEELIQVRSIVGEIPILIPGVGTQGGDAATAARNGMNSDSTGHIISTSSGAMFASDGADYIDATVANLTDNNNQIVSAAA